MKKVLALALALIMVFSMSAMAFAADATTTKAAATEKVTFTPGSMEALMDDFSIMGILDLIVDIAKATMSQWDQIENVVNKILDLINGMGTALVSEADVNGAVEDLETALAEVKDGDAKSKLADLINGLKAKIKALYAGEKATDVTVPETPADTGSASVGIAVFAAVSVAAAAAYVCTKKN